MSAAVEALYKLSSQIESDIESRELKWAAKYKSLKRDVKQWKKKAKHGKEMTRVLQRENERLWEFIFNHSLHGKTVEIPALGKKELVDLTGGGQKDEIPCVTPPKESESSTVIKKEKPPVVAKTEIVIEDTESEEEVIVATEEVIEKKVVEEEEVVVEEEEEVVVEEEEEEVVVEEEEEEVVVEEEEVVVEEEEEEVVEEEVVVEEEEEVVEEEEEQKEEVVVEQKEEVVVEQKEEEEEEELFEVEIDGVDYYTSNEVSGLIYEKKADGEVGEELGYFEDGEPGFYE